MQYSSYSYCIACIYKYMQYSSYSYCIACIYKYISIFRDFLALVLHVFINIFLYFMTFYMEKQSSKFQPVTFH